MSMGDFRLMVIRALWFIMRRVSMRTADDFTELKKWENDWYNSGGGSL